MWTPDYTGMWSTADGSVRKLLLPNGRYLAMIAHGALRTQGDYRIAGDIVSYHSDDGRTGQSCVVDGQMRHGDTVLTLEGIDDVEAA